MIFQLYIGHSRFEPLKGYFSDQAQFHLIKFFGIHVFFIYKFISKILVHWNQEIKSLPQTQLFIILFAT